MSGVSGVSGVWGVGGLRERNPAFSTRSGVKTRNLTADGVIVRTYIMVGDCRFNFAEGCDTPAEKSAFFLFFA